MFDRVSQNTLCGLFNLFIFFKLQSIIPEVVDIILSCLSCPFVTVRNATSFDSCLDEKEHVLEYEMFTILILSEIFLV